MLTVMDAGAHVRSDASKPRAHVWRLGQLHVGSNNVWENVFGLSFGAEQKSKKQKGKGWNESSTYKESMDRAIRIRSQLS